MPQIFKAWTGQNGVLAFGHRGSRGLRPENTLVGFELAIELGLDGVEMDVMRCGTGEPVVFHDYRLEYLTGYKGWTEGAPFDRLRRLDVGSSFHPRYRGERIPRLEEVLDLVGDRLILNLELKGEDTHGDGLERSVVDLVKKYKLVERVIISSFNPVRIVRVKRIAPEIPTGMLMQPDRAGWLRRLWFSPFMHAELLHPEISMVNSGLMARARKSGRGVIAWPANTDDDMRRLIEAGVDGIITDRPDRLLQALGRGTARCAPAAN